jgi:hypothetical protein
VAGQPLLFYALLNLESRKRPLINLFVAAIFPFFAFTGLVNVGFYLVPLLAVFAVYRWRRGGRLNGWLVAATILLGTGFLVCNYRLILHWAHGTGYVSHRTEFAQPAQSLSESLSWVGFNFVYGQYHAASCQFPVILLAAILAIATCFAKGADDSVHSRRGSPAPVALIVLLVACAVISLIVGLQDWQQTSRLLAAMHLRILAAFNFARVHWLDAALWGLIFALSLERIRTRFPFGTAVVAAMLMLQAVFILTLFHQPPDAATGSREKLTYHQFYSPELFAEIRDYIGKPQESYRVGSVGMHPAVALYNGFYNIDGYFYDYPLEYKHRFGKAIAGELAKDKKIADYFYQWGSRAYLFSSELNQDYFCTKSSKHRKVKDLAFNTDALRDLGANYILSAVEVDNSEALGWKLDRVFSRSDSPWQIYLYSIPPAKDAKH